MKVLIYGSRGWIGSQFVEIIKKSGIEYICGNSRVDNLDSLEKEIREINPTNVISFIGRTHGEGYSTIDYLEQEGKLVDNLRDNLLSPLQLGLLSLKYNYHYTYLGTGCIFKYDEEHNTVNGFSESSKPNFYGSSYSIVKGVTDQLMSMLESNVLNLRIRMPITGEVNARNFITKITTYNKICSIDNSMSVLPDLLPLVIELMSMRKCGTLNFTNPGVISHNEILSMFREIVDNDFVWDNFEIEDQRKILKSDRSNNYLETKELESMFKVKGIKESVRDILIEYRKSYKKRVNLLVTGGCGFIGSNFINYIYKSDKYNIVNVDAMYYCADENNIENIIRESNNYKLIKGNINDMELMDNVLRENKITHVIHFAAQSHVQNSFEDSLTFTRDNVLGTHSLLEVCRRYNKIKRFIHVSTDEVYGESMIDVDEEHKTEHSILCPTNPYAGTKAGAELIATSYKHSYKMPIIITRGNNVYGPNQYPEKLIPYFINLLKSDKKITIQGDGSQLRGFLHTYDTSRAFRIILERGEIGEIYNIGCDEDMEYSVLDVGKILINKIKKTEDYDNWIEYIDDRPFNDKRYYISNIKLKELGWSIEKNFEKGLEELIKKS